MGINAFGVFVQEFFNSTEGVFKTPTVSALATALKEERAARISGAGKKENGGE